MKMLIAPSARQRASRAGRAAINNISISNYFSGGGICSGLTKVEMRGGARAYVSRITQSYVIGAAALRK